MCGVSAAAKWDRQSLTCTQPDWQWDSGGLGVGRGAELRGGRKSKLALVTLKVAAIAAKCTFWCWATLTRVQLHFPANCAQESARAGQRKSQWAAIGMHWHAHYIPCPAPFSLGRSKSDHTNTGATNSAFYSHLLGKRHHWATKLTIRSNSKLITIAWNVKCCKIFKPLTSGSLREGFEISEQAFQPPGLDSCAETKPSGQNFPHLSFSAITTPEQNKPELSSFEMQYSFNF